MFTTRHAEDHYRLRMHRARSVELTGDELVEVRAAQRTFEGAYVRTSLSQFSFALVVLKIFALDLVILSLTFDFFFVVDFLDGLGLALLGFGSCAHSR